MSEPKYNAGGVIPGDPVPVRIQFGERCITSDETVYEFQQVEGGYRWVEIGKGYALWMGTTEEDQ